METLIMQGKIMLALGLALGIFIGVIATKLTMALNEGGE